MDTRENHDRRRAGASSLVVLDVLLLLMILATAVHTIVVSRMRVLGPVTKFQQDFWQRRANELCSGQVPLIPELPPNADSLQQMAFLDQLSPVSQKIWDRYQECLEPVTVVIDEELLHFKVDRYDQFESDPEPAFAKIRAYVDQNLKTHSQVYILGHTDDTFTDEYNYLLSYRRALYVAMVIQRHLAASKLQQGRNYALYPSGMGKAQPLARQANEGIEAWRTRCRRIELSFRSARSGQPRR